MSRDNYNMFEDYVAKIFDKAEYSVNQNVSLGTNASDIDIVAEKDGQKYFVEVKYSKIIERTLNRVCFTAKSCEMKPIVVTASYIEEKQREYYQRKYPDLILIDIANLLFAVQNDGELRNELVAGLPYTVDNIEPQECSILQIDYLQHDDVINSLIKEIGSLEAGKSTWRTYEKLCCELLNNTFSEDLALWKEQQKANNDLYRFDLLCRIKDGNKKTFWSILERYFNSKYVIFEFKNYCEPITQKEIYTTEKYLYAKALRSVGIIISSHGYDESASWAAKGCLRENGKLIILLETEDLIKMAKAKLDQEDPSNHLLDKLDDLLSELEK